MLKCLGPKAMQLSDKQAAEPGTQPQFIELKALSFSKGLILFILFYFIV